MKNKEQNDLFFGGGGDITMANQPGKNAPDTPPASQPVTGDKK